MWSFSKRGDTGEGACLQNKVQCGPVEFNIAVEYPRDVLL